MESQTEIAAPPPPPDISAAIRALEVGGSHLFPTESATSVRTLAARIGRALGRTFKTKVMADGVRVWRKPDQPA